ncbi:hypothetical protein SLA2020_253070 [Shorea laevis]
MLNFEEWLRKNAQAPMSTGAPYQNWSALFLSAIWVIWKSRNAPIFNKKRTPHHVLFQQASSLARDTNLVLATNILSSPRVPRWVRWFPPDLPFFKLNTDGALNNSTGQASAGGLIRDHGGWWIHGFAINIGPQSSYMAELWGCRAGLRPALELGLTHSVLEMDSLLAVQMIQARKARPGVVQLLYCCWIYISFGKSSFEVCTVQHTFWEGNSAADFMACAGHNLNQGIIFFQTPPSGMQIILHGDSIGSLFLKI